LANGFEDGIASFADCDRDVTFLSRSEPVSNFRGGVWITRHRTHPG
jgi:hypothetical protein